MPDASRSLADREPAAPPSGAAPAGENGSRPPASTSGFAPPPLPAFQSSFIGREREIAELVEFLRAGKRLLTLVGPGGVGKTRLVIATARAALDREPERFPDGVGFVRLETVGDAALVAPHVRQALGLRDQPGRAPVEALADHLRGREMLLVLDNFEHLLDAALVVLELLEACPRLAVLTTSRERLALSVEQVYDVRPLGLPESSPPPAGAAGGGSAAVPAPVAAVAASEAGRLFVERAQARQASFALTPVNAAAVDEIVRRLDGLPLAIELAAGHVGTLTPQAILALLDPALPLLAGGPRDAQPRHRALHDALAWSYDRLSPDRQALFRRLGVFVGGFDLEAVAAVAGWPEAAGERAGRDAVPALLALEALAEQHLVRVETAEGGEPRFGMLETAREYALRRLSESGEEQAARAAHAAYFLALADEAHFRGLRGPDQQLWLDRLDAEHPNFRAALDWALVRGEAATALGLARSLQSFWARRGYQREAQGWLERAVALAEADPVAAEELSALRASALLELGNNAMDLSDFERARISYEASLDLWQRLDEAGGAASALGNLGAIALRQGDFQEARERHEAALLVWQRTGDLRHSGTTHFALGEVALGEGDLDRAHLHAEEALGLSQAVGDASQVAFSYWLLGRVAREREDFVAAERFLAHADAIFVGARDKQGLGRALIEQAQLLHHQRRSIEARDRYRSALAVYRELGNLIGIVECVEGLALMAGSLGQAELAVRLLATVSGARTRLRIARTAHQEAEVFRTAALARASLGDERYESIADINGTWTLDEAADAAVNVPVAQPATARQRDAPKGTSLRLTPHQIKVLELVAEGLTDREVAHRLFISRRTVTTHMEHILAALGAERRAGAVALAIREGLISPVASDDERTGRA